MFKSIQVGATKEHLSQNANSTNKYSRRNGSDIEIHSNEDKLVNNNINKQTHRNKYLRQDNVKGSSITSKTYQLSEQNNQALLEKELRKKSDISLQHNVTKMFEQNSSQLLKYIKGNIFARALEFTETQRESKLFLSTKEW